MRRACLLSVVAAAISTGATAHADASANAAPKATLYAFWATWCVPCRVELPHMQRLHEAYKDKGLRVVLVSEDAPSTAQTIPSFLARHGVTAEWVLDDESELLERYNPTANVPYTVVLDASGKLAYAHAGYEPGDERLVEATVVELLARVTDREPGENAGEPQVRVTSNTQGLGVVRTSKFFCDDNPPPGAPPCSDPRLSVAVGRVEVAGYTRDYNASVRVDGALLDERLDAGEAGTLDEDMDARIERIRVDGTFGPVKLLAGDDYISFGHGVSLSLRRVDPLGFDTSLRGGRADLTIERARVTTIAGWTNPQNLDPIELDVVKDVRDFIAGTEVKIPIGKQFSVAPYGLVVHANHASSTDMDVDWLIGGASTSIERGPVRIAAEGAGGSVEGVAAGGDKETMWAAYTSAQWARGPVTVLVDAKAYRHWEIGRSDRSLLYHEPPTLEREDQEVPGNEDAVGARTRIEWRLPTDITLFGNLLRYNFKEDRTSAVGGDVAVHGYAGVDKVFGSGQLLPEGTSTSVAAGYRDENRETGADKLSLWHVDFDAAIPLPNNFGLTLKWNHRQETKFLAINDLRFRRGLAVATLALSGVGAISGLYGYSTEDSTTPTYYPAGEVLVHLPKGGNARLFFGKLTGGRVCVSGSCRDVPPFEGARLDLLWRM